METVTLNNGIQVPQFGLGLRGLTDPDICEQVVLAAFREGYRHLDTAQIFHNEAFVGNALIHSGLPREEIFLTTKLPASHYLHPQHYIERSLKRLRTDYVDLLLLNHPCGNWRHAWRALEQAQEQGLARAIGVCHFVDPLHLHELKSIAHIRPAVDQVECHPYIAQTALKETLAQDGIRLAAIYPIAHGRRILLENATLLSIAKKHRRTTLQVILRWHIQSGHILFPGTRNPDHMRSNLHIYDFSLEPEDMEAIASVDIARALFQRRESAKRLLYSFIG